MNQYVGGIYKAAQDDARRLSEIEQTPPAIALLRRLTDAAQAILAADSPDHTLTPTDEQWGEIGRAHV